MSERVTRHDAGKGFQMAHHNRPTEVIYREEQKVIYHLNVINEDGDLVDLSNAFAVINDPKFGIIEIHFNEPPEVLKDRRMCLYCGGNVAAEKENCQACGAPKEM